MEWSPACQQRGTYDQSPGKRARGSQRLRSGRFVGNSYLGITSGLPVTRPEPVASVARAAISHHRASRESARFHFPGERINRDPLNLRRRAKWAGCTQGHKGLRQNSFDLRRKSAQWSYVDCAFAVRQSLQNAKLGNPGFSSAGWQRNAKIIVRIY
jgi:hypothetical protein